MKKLISNLYWLVTDIIVIMGTLVIMSYIIDRLPMDIPIQILLFVMSVWVIFTATLLIFVASRVNVFDIMNDKNGKPRI